MAYRNYSTAVSHIVDATIGNGGTALGDFTTIQAAIDASKTGQTIFIRPGTYTENLTLKAGIDLTAFESDELTPNVIINGTCSFTQAGVVNLSGLALNTNGSFALSVTGSNPSLVNLLDCNVLLNGADIGIDMASSHTSSEINIFNCLLRNGGTGTVYAMSSPGNIFVYYSQFENASASSGISNNNAGTVTFVHSQIANPIQTSGFGTIQANWSEFTTVTTNSTAIMLNGNATYNNIFECSINSGSGVAIDIGSLAVVYLQTATIASSNTNAIQNAGNLHLGVVTFFPPTPLTSSSSTILNTGAITNLVTTIGSLSLNTPLTIPNGGTNATSFTQTNGIVAYDGTSLVNYAGPQLSSSGVMTNTSQIAFSAYLGTSVSNATGNGTPYVLGSTQALTIEFDQGSNFNTNGTFTAPVTGRYCFQAGFLILNCTIAAEAIISFIDNNSSLQKDGRNNRTASSNNFGVLACVFMTMTAGDTLNVEIIVNGEAADTNTIQGSQQNTWFSGFLVC